MMSIIQKIGYFAVFLALPSWVFAARQFEIKQGSDIYQAHIQVENCEDNSCGGKGIITLTKKKNVKFKQVLTSADLSFFLDKNQKPSVNIIQLYNEQSPLIFDDFNFDGHEDVAVRNGNNSSYSGPSYDVYVFNITHKKFVLSQELTNLANQNLGMFQTDSKRKRLITFNKSGCCWHITEEYVVIPRKGLKKVYVLEEDALHSEDETVTVTKRELVRNKWKIQTKKYKIKDYYR